MPITLYGDPIKALDEVELRSVLTAASEDAQDAVRLAKLAQLCYVAHVRYGRGNRTTSITMTFNASVETSIGHRRMFRILVDSIISATKN